MMERRYRGGRLRPNRTTSPTCAAERRIRRKRDPGADEMIRFVRDFQIQKQPTLLRLQKRAPLPSIGQLAVPSVEDSGFVDRIGGGNDSDSDSLLDDEVAAIENNAASLRHNEYKIMCEMDVFQRKSLDASRSFQTYTSKQVGLFKYDNVLNSYGRLNIGRKNQPSLNQLPPIQRDELPERPAAPSPSVTPPLPGEDLDSAGEPVDFIDPS